MRSCVRQKENLGTVTITRYRDQSYLARGFYMWDTQRFHRTLNKLTLMGIKHRDGVRGIREARLDDLRVIRNLNLKGRNNHGAR